MTATIFLILRILLSISLYVFILVIFYFLWLENRQQGIILSKRKIPNLSISINTINTPDRIRNYYSEEVTIGRDLSCDCPLNDENVSNHHARLKYHHTQWWLEDLGSKNGTIINNSPLLTPVVVISGDEIICGKHTLTLTISGENMKSPIKKFPIPDNGEENG